MYINKCMEYPIRAPIRNWKKKNFRREFIKHQIALVKRRTNTQTRFDRRRRRRRRRLEKTQNDDALFSNKRGVFFFCEGGGGPI